MNENKTNESKINTNVKPDTSFLEKTKCILFSKKLFNSQNLEETQLSRVLKLTDLVFLGVSSTLGSGVYVLAGSVIGEFTGPAVLISFLIAGFCSFFSGLCYAELGSRVPRSGSAYVYIYVTIGEFIAFIIGWDIILEYIIGTSSTASMLSAYIDYLASYRISKYFKNTIAIDLPGNAEYPDFLAFGLCLIVGGLLIIGVKESSLLNKIFTFFNLLIIAFIVIAGARYINIDYWNLKILPNTSWTQYDGNTADCQSSSDRCGNGGFAPFGLNGVLLGTATCFYAFVGFDVIATTGEEVLNAKKTIPLSILITLLIVTMSYCSVSAILSLMIPYYQMDILTPLPQAFEFVGLGWASPVLSTGAIISLATCVYASMFPMPRVVYSMASDGLIFRFLGVVEPKLKTPILACISTSLSSAILSLIFNISDLVEMMSIGTLMAYSLVSACTLVLRYRPFDEQERENLELNNTFSAKILDRVFGFSDETLLSRLFSPKSEKCTKLTSRLVNVIFFTDILVIILLILTLSQNENPITNNMIYLIFVLILVILLLSFIIFKQPQNCEISTFKVPFMPILPLLAIFLNSYLMSSMKAITWLRFIIWFLIGMIVYFTYGIRNSNERINRNQTVYECLVPIKTKIKNLFTI